jgi:hypothetical protein
LDAFHGNYNYWFINLKVCSLVASLGENSVMPFSKKKKKERKKKKEKKRKKKEMTALCLDVPFLSRQWYIYAAIYWWNLL